ncbi:MAG: DUF3035 domain-containing protein [Rhodospirillales bacterium]|nr:DUF3035 domain-containing protein [Rhodospirillales bacterium]
MKKSYVTAGTALIAMLVLSGCDTTRRALGQTKDPPDEFAVFTRAPLSLPPEYNIRPPKPGATRPQAVQPRDLVRQALSGATTRRSAGKSSAGGGRAASAAERAILQRSGAANPDPNIRQLVNRETSFFSEEDKTFADRIVFWGVATQFGDVVDAKKEARRINERQALGRPLAGSNVPTIKRKNRAILEGVFD